MAINMKASLQSESLAAHSSFVCPKDLSVHKPAEAFTMEVLLKER